MLLHIRWAWLLAVVLSLSDTHAGAQERFNRGPQRFVPQILQYPAPTVRPNPYSGAAPSAYAAWAQMPAWQVTCVRNAVASQHVDLNQLIGAGITPSDPRLGNILAQCRRAEQARTTARTFWQSVPPSIQGCVTKSLSGQGLTIDILIANGIGPDDPRISPTVDSCNSREAAETAARAKSQAAEVARHAWNQLTGTEGICMEAGLQSRGQTRDQLIQAGRGPSDSYLADIKSECHALAETKLGVNVPCRVDVAGVHLTTRCDERFAKLTSDGLMQQLDSASAAAAMMRGESVSRQLVERADATGRRSQMPSEDLVQGLVPAPSFDCSKARAGTEQTVCSSYELTKLDIRIADYWNRVKGLDISGSQQSSVRHLIDARYGCGTDQICIKDNYIKGIDEFAGFLTANGQPTQTYAEAIAATNTAASQAKMQEAERARLADAKRAAQERARQAEAERVTQGQTAQTPGDAGHMAVSQRPQARQDLPSQPRANTAAATSTKVKPAVAPDYLNALPAAFSKFNFQTYAGFVVLLTGMAVFYKGMRIQ